MSQRLPSLKSREVLRALERAGFATHHVSGSHYVLKHSHSQKPQLRVTLPWQGHCGPKLGDGACQGHKWAAKKESNRIRREKLAARDPRPSRQRLNRRGGKNNAG
jgi:predicted RNA binding protein YcfA (HicA-like mRNA interferase family)